MYILTRTMVIHYIKIMGGAKYDHAYYFVLHILTCFTMCYTTGQHLRS